MAGERAFDPVVWANSDVVAASSTNGSPELVPLTPKKKLYNTVGTEKKAEIPQLTAPNRIQRDGAGRRPFAMQNMVRQGDSHYSPRGPSQQLNMQTSMQYAQQFTQNTNYNHSQGPTSYPSYTGRPGRQDPTEQAFEAANSTQGEPTHQNWELN